MWRSATASQRSIVWRDTLLPLKQEASANGYLPCDSVVAALESLISQPHSTAVKENEVSEDLSFLAQQLNSLHARGYSDGRGEVLYCRLVASVLRSRHVAMQPAAASIVCSTLRRWADSRPDDDDESGDRQLQVEALSALTTLLQDNLLQVPGHERTAALALLFALVQARDSLSSSTGLEQRRQVARPSEVQRQALNALTACCPGKPATGGTTPSGLTPEQISAALGCTVSALSSAASEHCAPPEDNAYSRFLVSLLRALNGLIVESKRLWVPHTGAIVNALRLLMLYGVAPKPSSTESPKSRSSASSSWRGQGPSCEAEPRMAAELTTPAVKARYTPPHQRASNASTAAASSTASGPFSRASASGSTTPVGGTSRRASHQGVLEDEDAVADVDSKAFEDRFKSSRVRLGLLQCLQSMAKSDSRALHQHWTTLLPTQAPLQPRPLLPHLLVMVLHDPVPKVRNMAAAATCGMLEGPAQRSFLAVAESRDPGVPLEQQQQQQQPSSGSGAITAPLEQQGLHRRTSGSGAPSSLRGFTTLSTLLGQLVVATHDGLLHAVASEAVTGTLQVVLRALCVLMAGSPYDRLPSALLPQAFEGLRACWKRQQESAGEAGMASPSQQPELTRGGSWGRARPSTVLATSIACIACMAEGVSTKQPLPGLAAYFRQQQAHRESCADEQQVGETAPLQQPLPLVSDLLRCCHSRHAMLRVEALAVLRGISLNYAFVLDGFGGAPEAGSPCSQQAPIPPACWDGVLNAVKCSLEGSTAPKSPAAVLPRRPAAAEGSTAAANTSASTSPEDKAAQHAVQLLGAFLASQAAKLGLAIDSGGFDVEMTDAADGPAAAPAVPGTHPLLAASGANGDVSITRASRSDAAFAGILESWRQALALLQASAFCSPSYMVRSAALAVVASLPEAVATLLRHDECAALVELLLQATSADTAAAVRSMAARALGSLSSHLWLLCGPSVNGASLSPSSGTLNGRQGLGSSQQRSPAGAEAGGCGRQQPPADIGDFACSVSGALVHGLSDSVLSVRISCSWALASICEAVREAQRHGALPPPPGGKGQQPQALTPGGGEGQQALRVRLLRTLMDGSLVAMRDVDKVRANGVLGTTALLSLLGTGAGGGGPDTEAAVSSWLEQVLSSLQSCLTTGNIKVQWDAASAVEGLLANEALLGDAVGAGRVAPLLLLLVMLVRDCGNFKIRTHAAAALAAPAHRRVYGDVYPDALMVVAGALDGQLDSAMAAADPASSDAAASAHASAMEPDRATPAAAQSSAPPDARFPNYRYAAGLSQQLSVTLLHLLALAEAADGARLREALLKRAELLRRVLTALAEDAVMASELWCLAAPAAVADGLTCPASRPPLPSDPFELAPEPERLILPGPYRGKPGMHLRARPAGSVPLTRCLQDALEAVRGKIVGGEADGARVVAQGNGAAEKPTQLSAKAIAAAFRGVGVLLQGVQAAASSSQRGTPSGVAALSELADAAGHLEAWHGLEQQFRTLKL